MTVLLGEPIVVRSLEMTDLHLGLTQASIPTRTTVDAFAYLLWQPRLFGLA